MQLWEDITTTVGVSHCQQQWEDITHCNIRVSIDFTAISEWL